MDLLERLVRGFAFALRQHRSVYPGAISRNLSRGMTLRCVAANCYCNLCGILAKQRLQCSAQRSLLFVRRFLRIEHHPARKRTVFQIAGNRRFRERARFHALPREQRCQHLAARPRAR